VETHGWGQGQAVIADSSYRRLHTIHAHGNGVKIDHHEFNLTAKDTALVTIFWPHSGVDTSKIGGNTNSTIVSGVCQEIDPATGKLLFHWDSLEHVPVEKTYEAFAGGTPDDPYDYFHINSLAYASDGNLLISSRDTWCIYKVSRQDGHIIWRLNGKDSDFEMGPGTHFYWQHHVRPHADGIMTVFDNGALPAEEKQSRALVLHVDETKMKVTLEHAYTHPGQKLLASAMGSCQLLPNGNVFVGWGTNPYFSEFAADGKLVLAGEMTPGNPSYRTFAADWTGYPEGKPDLVARKRTSGGKATLYASWNGATAVRGWRVLSGRKRSSLAVVGTGHRSGFETTMVVQDGGPYFAVQALGSSGNVLVTSDTVKIS
jgi:hypothetical protein